MSVPAEQGSYPRDREQAGLGTLQRQLICPICLEVFTKPVVILPCQHNLCRKCANDLYQPSLFQVGSGGRFRCPSCSQEVVLDRHGVYGLQRNLLVENIIDVYKQESTSSRSTSSKPAGQPTCEEHDGEKVNIYCVTCQVPTCSLCKVFGAHNTCQVAPLTQVYQQQKAELIEGVSSLVASNGQVQAFINELEVTCKNVEENCKTQKQTVCERFDRMLAILEERRRIMTQRITDEQEERTGHAHSLVRSYGESVETNTKLVETAMVTMQDPEMAAFVKTAKDLIVKVNEASSTCIVETLEPGYENMDHYRVNFNAEKRALYKLDFIKVEEEGEPEPETECEPVLDLEPEPVLEQATVLEPVALPVLVQELEPESVPQPVLVPVLMEDLQTEPEPVPVQKRQLVPEHVAVLEPVAFPGHVAVLEPVAFPGHVAVLEPVAFPEHVAVLEPVEVLEPESASSQVLDAEPVLELKTVGGKLGTEGPSRADRAVQGSGRGV
ncbi:tripartite motif-containing protein 54 isoform X1 [Coregonus clupeaformis]|uniref:tripartite motif-containing protein 54 isoform X1 n=1 Tax=Coregonus clupeaformis TaxID=59861 RepID=UPI001E1C8604|nr:tripartite motif-containing protein 54 isoform X1 [Coregonus clupeaformis]XP_041701312.2 tripartite motif-containing protein 54 isoform X1 [Coregonus clupeaformis]XP_041701313.2 tripartite motif-containing protein 54 isoform X1 [Coregonus clupeaformis]XP_041701315.2 tripartite motif-containing protein 54 isoform X1 [Coregonus clupeaformis]XP_045063190.1 tripartite motif-containing protein 54 isoform X1 [Coregonus clupeaformis]